MKRCHQCNRVEKDNALAFCRAVGARLIADTEALEPVPAILPANAASSELTAGYLQGVPSIAVLPFANMSADPKNEYFWDAWLKNSSTR